MLDQQKKNILESAFKRGQTLHDRTLTERLVYLETSARYNLANLSILGLVLDFEGIKQFSEISGTHLSDSEHLTWLGSCLEMNLLTQIANTDTNTVHWRSQDDVCAYFAANSNIEDLRHYHLNADRFLLEQLSSLARNMEIVLPDGEARREAIIGPYGLLNHTAHIPQHQEFHQSILNLAINWFDHLFWLEEYNEAANILNHICFALARRGQRKMAENMLAMIAGKTKGLANLAARINLATLLREEQQTSAAMHLYWGTIPELMRKRSYVQLAQVLTEMAAIYRQNGKLVRSAMILEFSVILNRWLKNGKSTAIAHSQLASTYRYLRIYLLALNNSKLAVDHFRKTNDFLNLGRSLLTQGNIYNNLSRSDLAVECFNESLAIGQQIADPQALIGSTSGKARVLLLLKNYDEAQSLLTEAISLRERHNDHNIGIEYQNMGALHEKKGNFALALGWYQKALVQFDKYMPAEASGCRRNIAAVEAKYRSG